MTVILVKILSTFNVFLSLKYLQFTVILPNNAMLHSLD